MTENDFGSLAELEKIPDHVHQNNQQGSPWAANRSEAAFHSLHNFVRRRAFDNLDVADNSLL